MKKILSLLLILMFSLTIASCTENDDKQALNIIDMTGRNIQVKAGEYKRVVCIGAGALRLYAYIGDMDLLVGVEDIENESLTNRPKMFDQAPRPYVMANSELFKSLPSCGVGGPNNQAPEMEKILACNPDIIISEYTDKNVAEAISNAIGVPVVTLSYGTQGVFDDRLKQSLIILGLVFDKTARANELISFIQEERKTIEKRVKDVDKENAAKVYIAGLGNWGTTNHLMTSSHYAPFEVANINNCLDIERNGIYAIDKEKFESIASDIDIMILDAASIKNIKPLLKEDHDLFINCKAWNNNQVYLQMAYNVYYTNIEIALANAWFNAKVVYPECFEDIDITQKLDEITNTFLGKNLSANIYQLANSFGGYQQIDVNEFFK